MADYSSYLILAIAAFAGSALTFFSGFGLGTLLLPVFTLFFPAEIAITVTAIVHFLNNIFKLILIGKAIDTSVLRRFGIMAVVGSFAGAWLLGKLSFVPPIYSYHWGDAVFSVTLLRLVVAAVLLFFVLWEMLPNTPQFNARYLPAGGLLSGFFGGLSGMQGALRSAFLMQLQLSKETFIATGVAIACCIDMARLLSYSGWVFDNHHHIPYMYLFTASIAAFGGAYWGNRYLKKMSLHLLHRLVAVLLILFSLLLAMGIL